MIAVERCGKIPPKEEKPGALSKKFWAAVQFITIL